MRSDVSALLTENAETLFERAQAVAKKRESCFRWPIFFNTGCTMNPPCCHCLWYGSRHYDVDWKRRYSREEVVKKAKDLVSVGIKKIHVPSGWMGPEVPEYYYDYIAAIKAESAAEVYGYFGPVSRECLVRLKQAGMDGYWTGIEVMNEQAFHALRPGDSLESRLRTLRETKELGLKLWSSFLMGVGETDEDIARSIEFLRDLGAESVMVVPVKPIPFTEFERADFPNPYRVAKTMATARIALPEAVDIVSFAGMSYVEWGIRAGANAFDTSYPWEMAKIDYMRKTFYASGAH